MKLAVLSESPADEAAVRVLVEGLCGANLEFLESPSPRTRGWQGVVNFAETVLRHLHYRTLAEGLVCILDSDESPIHHGLA